MPSAEIELVQRVFEAFERRDPEALAACFHEDGVLETQTARIAGHDQPYSGHDGLRRYLADVARVWEELRPEPSVFHEPAEGRVVATGRVYAWGLGRVVDGPAGWIFDLRDGRVVRVRIFETAREAVRAGGVSA